MSEHGVSPGTIATYTDDLTVYFKQLVRENLRLSEVWDDSSYAFSTLVWRRSILRFLHRFMVTESYGEADPITKLVLSWQRFEEALCLGYAGT